MDFLNFYRNTHVLVTGGAGCIGWNLVRTLVRIPGCRITVLDDFSSGNEMVDEPQVSYVRGSITDDQKLKQIFGSSEMKPAVVFHLAAHFANQNSVEHPEKDLEVNGSGTLKLLRWAHAAHVRQFVFASSSCVYGDASETREDAMLSGFSTPYAVHKFLGELYCRYFYRAYGQPVIILRYFNCYGPGELPGRYRNVIPNFIMSALNGKPLRITGTGKETRDFNFVEDVVQKTLFIAARQDTIGETYNIGTGTETTIQEIVQMINELTGSAAGIEFAGKREWDSVMRRKADIRKFIALDYKGHDTSLEEGIRKTIEYLNNKFHSSLMGGIK